MCIQDHACNTEGRREREEGLERGGRGAGREGRREEGEGGHLLKGASGHLLHLLVVTEQAQLVG